MSKLDCVGTICMCTVRCLQFIDLELYCYRGQFGNYILVRSCCEITKNVESV
jgi:hypothetical protein